MNHPHGEKLSAYLDGMLDVAQMRDVAAHLGVCPACRAAHADLGRTKALLGAVAPPAAPPPEFWAGAYRRMRVRDAARRPAGLAWGGLRDALREPQRRWSAGVAAAVLLAAAVAAPVYNARPPALVPAPAPAPLPDSVDVSSLVQAHAESAAHQPLADTGRQAMIAMDDSSTPDDNGPDAPPGAADAGGDAAP